MNDEMIIGGRSAERIIEVTPPGITIRIWAWRFSEESSHCTLGIDIEWLGKVWSFSVSTATGILDDG